MPCFPKPQNPRGIERFSSICIQRVGFLAIRSLARWDRPALPIRGILSLILHRAELERLRSNQMSPIRMRRVRCVKLLVIGTAVAACFP